MRIISTSVICAAKVLCGSFLCTIYTFSFIHIYILNKHTGERWKEEKTDRNLEGEGERGA